MHTLPSNARKSAMGIICAPAYANIFMGNLELKHIYPYIKNKTKMFSRFIDDLFMIRTGWEQELLDLISDLNKRYPSIKFKFKYSQTKIEFLDVLVYKDHDNMLQKTIYRKQTDQKITLMPHQNIWNSWKIACHTAKHDE